MWVFAKFWIKRIKRNFGHTRTLVFNQTLASIEEYGRVDASTI
jgi:hypothetical protein